MSAVTNEQVQERVVEALASFGPDASQITREATFEELDIDSLDLVELAQIVEDEYGVVLKGEDMKELKTVGGGIETVEIQHDVMRDRGPKMVSPLGIPQYMPNAAAAAVSMKHGLQGQMYGVVSACSGGAHALGSAMRMIQYGDADAVVAGGSEASLTPFGFACFQSMQ